PLAQSDYLLADKDRSIRILCEGLTGEIQVNGKKYAGAMPAAVIDDAGVADLLSYIRSAWGNMGEAVTSDEVKLVRSKTQFATFEKLQAASVYPPLPKPPEGFTLREVVRMPAHCVRMASDGKGDIIYLLCENGDVWRLQP